MRAYDRVPCNAITTASADQRVCHTARVSSVSRVSGRDFSRRPHSKKIGRKGVKQIGEGVAERAFDLSPGIKTILFVVYLHKPYVLKCL